jgi:hypothetical protein
MPECYVVWFCVLLAERLAVRPHSRGSWLQYAQALDLLGNAAGADAARQRAAAL